MNVINCIYGIFINKYTSIDDENNRFALELLKKRKWVIENIEIDTNERRVG